MDNRAEIRRLEKAFVARTEQYIGQVFQNLEKQFIKAVKICRTPTCLASVKTSYNQVSDQTFKYFEFISEQLEQCIEKEHSQIGVEGYKKCFSQFELVLGLQAKKNLFQV